MAILNSTSLAVSLNFSPTAAAGILTVQLLTVCGDIGAQASISIALGNAEFCILASCARNNIFVDTAMLSIPGALGVYKVSDKIHSDALLMTSIYLKFKAGGSIEIFPPFTVETRATFLAEIESCDIGLWEGKKE